MNARIGRVALSEPGVAARREWLVTNGLGGYASGTVSGALTRRYHGLLVAALQPPVGRTLLLAKFAERVTLDGAVHALDADHWATDPAPGPPSPRLEAFDLEDSVPVWTWAWGDTRLRKRVWMEQGENVTWIEYELLPGGRPLALELHALVNARDAHATRPHGAGAARVEAERDALRILAPGAPAPLWLAAPGADLVPDHTWWRGFRLALETERGLDDVEDHLCAAVVRAPLSPGERLRVSAGAPRAAGSRRPRFKPAATALARRRAHERALLTAWRRAQPAAARGAPAWVRQLVLAADQFVVERTSHGDPEGRTVIAGYPWFSDWGRDTMISLPGLALVTGRPAVARRILETFLAHADGGMLPNVFPDGGEPPEYNTVDAALWAFQAVRAYVDATRDRAFLESAWPALEGIIHAYERGTRHGIRVDADGLVTQGEPGVQLTWMDARVDDWVVTPRHGKPVEVNALWYGALAAMAAFADRLGRRVGEWHERASRVEAAFGRFWNAERGCLYDVLDGPHGHDPAIRPNQVFAVSLPDSPLPPERQRAVVDVVGRLLVTPHGLRSLAPGEPGYRGVFAGDRRARDGAYHQGTVWTWLLPHYALAHARVHHDRAAALALLEPLGDLAWSMGVGTLPEVADGDPPHTPRGCFAQAWSVAETLRAWHALSGTRAPAATKRTRRRTPRDPLGVA
uniref:Glycogen debranching protein n=1 Tax=Eiseniibacteriota bacterium TaxID=2212470 RepID=A0A832MNE6_UNCEI